MTVGTDSTSTDTYDIGTILYCIGIGTDGTCTGTGDTGMRFDGTGTGTEGTDSTSTDAYDSGTILSHFH